MLLFNRYQFQPSTDLIGKGELTRVYKALDKQIYLPVAVKIYRGNDPVEKFGFVNVKKFIAMDHPNICRYLHIEDVEKESPLGEKERTQVCVMELVQDGDFGTYYQERKDLELLRKMVVDILRGLSYLHSQGIVHRRLKPSNLLVAETTQGPEVKITDFGLGSGKAAMRDARLSSIVVEVTHMAPEQFNPRKYGMNGKVSYHIDFWGVGLAIYEALTNNDVLFKNSPEDSREQVMQNILSPALPEKLKRLPAPFDKVVARCLAKHVGDRVQNTRELLELLSQPITTQDDVYETVVLPAMAREEAEAEREEAAAEAAKRQTALETREYSESVVRAMVKRAVGKAEPVGAPAASTASASAPAGGVSPASAPAAEVMPVVVAKEVETPRAAPEVEAPKIAAATVAESITLFNRYEYNTRTGFIGKGGFSRVYKALDKKLDRWVALKLYKTGEVADRYSPFAEIRRVINLDHPNICRYLDIEEMEKENAFGEKEVTQICVMELLDGGNLLDYYTAHSTEETLKRLLTDVLKGLQYLHKNGIIHRDIKPANILIKETYDGPVAKITDFGISKLSDSINNHNQSALVVSIPYMAPEQLNVRKYGIDENISYNLDLWSLGVTIYEIITGQVLFKNSEKDTSEQIMTNIMAPELPEKINDLPQPFLDIVRRCVIKDARERVQRAEELIELLHQPVVPTMPVPVEVVDVAPAVEEPPVMEEREIKIVPEVWRVPEIRRTPEAQPISEVERHDEEEEKMLAIVETADADYDPYYKPNRQRPRGKIVALRIAIVLAALVLAGGLYVGWQNPRFREALGLSTPQPVQDPGQGGSGGSATPQQPAANAAVPPSTAAPADSTKTKTNATASTEKPEKKHKSRKERVVTDTTGTEDAAGARTTGATDADTKEAGSTGAMETRSTRPAGGTETKKYVLVLSTPTTCNVVINNAPYGVLESGKTMKVYLSVGNYIIQATSTSNASAVYTGRLIVEEENLNQVGKYTIPL